MSPQVQKKAALKGKKPVGNNNEKKFLDENEVLMKEILAMGGSEQDLELLKGIDTDSEIEEEIESEKKHIKKSVSAKKSSTSTSEPVDEPKLKSEVANFMKTLFGSALAAHEVMSDEEEKDEDGDDQVDGNQSEGSWETEEEDNDEGDDSGDDSMDDLPQELKDINAQLESKKRKADSAPAPTSITPAKAVKKAKIETPVVQKAKKTTPAKSPDTDKKKGTLVNIQKQVSALIGKPEPKPAKKESKPTELTKSKALAGQKPKTTTTSKPTATKVKTTTLEPKKAAWKLGDGWSKAFEDEKDVDNVSNSKGKKNTQKQKQQSFNKSRGASFKSKK
ncbi:hypothetical protein BGX27_003003 [Mortierella sp. AM989]|nr:hypothetical protein BGX27_003003 [Mortierella sp. AM989]